MVTLKQLNVNVVSGISRWLSLALLCCLVLPLISTTHDENMSVNSSPRLLVQRRSAGSLILAANAHDSVEVMSELLDYLKVLVPTTKGGKYTKYFQLWDAVPGLQAYITNKIQAGNAFTLFLPTNAALASVTTRTANLGNILASHWTAHPNDLARLSAEKIARAAVDAQLGSALLELSTVSKLANETVKVGRRSTVYMRVRSIQTNGRPGPAIRIQFQNVYSTHHVFVQGINGVLSTKKAAPVNFLTAP